MVREWIPASERGLTNSIFMAGTQAGPAVGALIVAWIVSLIGWRASFVVVGAVGGIRLIAWLLWYDRPERVAWLGDEERAKILRERDADSSALEERSASAMCSDCFAPRPCGDWRCRKGARCTPSTCS